MFGPALAGPHGRCMIGLDLSLVNCGWDGEEIFASNVHYAFNVGLLAMDLCMMISIGESAMRGMRMVWCGGRSWWRVVVPEAEHDPSST
jgi:hypothetical protein